MVNIFGVMQEISILVKEELSDTNCRSTCVVDKKLIAPEQHLLRSLSPLRFRASNFYGYGADPPGSTHESQRGTDDGWGVLAA